MLVAGTGVKVIVVTLVGQVQTACRVPVQTDAFEAVYNDHGLAPDEKDTEIYTQKSAGFTFGDDWMIQDGRRVKTAIRGFKTGPVVIRVAFSLPENVTSFVVRYPANASEKARLTK